MTDEEGGRENDSERETYLGNYFAQLCQLLLEAPMKEKEGVRENRRERASRCY